MKGNHIVEKFNIIYRSTGEILFKLSKIINLKTLLKNKDKFKRTKVTSISELTGKICGGVEGVLPEKASVRASEWAYSWKSGRALKTS